MGAGLPPPVMDSNVIDRSQVTSVLLLVFFFLLLQDLPAMLMKWTYSDRGTRDYSSCPALTSLRGQVYFDRCLGLAGMRHLMGQNEGHYVMDVSIPVEIVYHLSCTI